MSMCFHALHSYRAVYPEPLAELPILLSIKFRLCARLFQNFLLTHSCACPDGCPEHPPTTKPSSEPTISTEPTVKPTPQTGPSVTPTPRK